MSPTRHEITEESEQRIKSMEHQIRDLEITNRVKDLQIEKLEKEHERLVTSIHAKEESEGLDPEFQNEIRKRVVEIDSGKAVGVEAFGALKNV